MRQLIALALAASLLGLAGSAFAADEQSHETPQPPRQKWSFSGPFGHYDKGQLQRGFKVYKEVCAVCHGLKYVAFRNLDALGYSEGQVKAIASEYKIPDGPNDQGEMFERAGRPADYFPAPWPNENAARARYNGVPPDFSVLAKARGYERGFPWFIFDMFTQFQEHGVDYIHALMVGYKEKPPARRHAAQRARSTTSISPATPSPCRRRCPTSGSITPTARRPRSISTPRTSRRS